MAKKRAAKRAASVKAAARLKWRMQISDGVFFTRQGYVINVRLDRLCLAADFQRELCKAQAELIHRQFNWNFLGMPIAVPVGRGRYLVVDGMHRLDGQQARYPSGIDDNGEEIWVGVLVPYEGEPWEIYEAMNKPRTRRNMTYNDCFKAALAGGRPEEVFIFDTLENNGITLAFTKGNVPAGVCKAPAACKKLYTAARGEDNFRQLVDMLVESFSRPDGEVVEEAALKSDFITGLAQFVVSSEYSIEIITHALWWANVSAADIIQRKDLQVRKSRNGWVHRAGIQEEIRKLVAEYFESYGHLHDE